MFCKDQAVIREGLNIIRVTFPFYFVYAIMEVTGGIVKGIGKTIPSMLIIILNLCVLRVILLDIFVENYHRISAVAAVYPITWVAAMLCFIWYYRYVCYKKIRSEKPISERTV